MEEYIWKVEFVNTDILSRFYLKYKGVIYF